MCFKKIVSHSTMVKMKQHMNDQQTTLVGTNKPKLCPGL